VIPKEARNKMYLNAEGSEKKFLTLLKHVTNTGSFFFTAEATLFTTNFSVFLKQTASFSKLLLLQKYNWKI
jgi:hypothetical protein